MKQPLNPEKSQKLRPLRIILAVLIAVLVVLVLDRLPTSVKDRESNQNQSQTGDERSAEQSSAKTGAEYYYFSGFLDILEEQTEEKLQSLGVPEEEYKNAAEYFSKDELLAIETKATLAANLEEVYVETTDEGIVELRQIFNLDEDYSFERFQKLTGAPAEYKILAELLDEYHKTLNTVEDYDIVE